MSHSETHSDEKEMEQYGLYSAAALTFSEELCVHLGQGDKHAQGAIASSVRFHIHSFTPTDVSHRSDERWAQHATLT
jgi:hypothetical protein